jgi:carboxymethylenebutenolidase
MQTSDLKLDTPDGPARAYLAMPATDPRGGIVVIPEAFGLNEHIEGVARRYAESGYASLGVDVFHRSGQGVAPYDDFKKAMAIPDGLEDEGFLADLDAAVALLATIGIDRDRIAVVGFCIGGRLSFLAAVRRRLGAAISYYGGGIVDQGAFPAMPPLLAEVDSLQTPWLGFFGDLDRSIPTEHVETLRSALAAVAVPYEVVRYPEATHGFNCDARPSYNEAASSDSFARAIDWLQRHLQ